MRRRQDRQAEAFKQFQYLTVPLEPFSSLRLDYLMSLLDEDERAGVDALVRAVAAGTGKVLAAVPADERDVAEAGL
jgi:hypothetical protein